MIHEVPNRGGNAISTGALIAGATYVQSGLVDLIEELHIFRV
jgi:hypothetical protein